MRNAQKPDRISLNKLIANLRNGHYVIPDFQREFEWGPQHINALMRSIFLDYYIGSLLLWKGKPKNFADMACEPIYGMEPSHNRSTIVLDGQQRLSAMYYAFCAPNKPAPGKKNPYFFFIRIDEFMRGEYDQAFEYDYTARAKELVSDRDRQFESHKFPIQTISQEGWNLLRWVLDYQKYWENKKQEAENEHDLNEAQIAIKNAEEFGNHLKGITEEYQIAYIELGCGIELDKVCDIFTQINTRGIQLSVFDLMNALLKPKEVQLKQLWRDASENFALVDTKKMNVYVLQVMSILRQNYCSPKYLYYLVPGAERKMRRAEDRSEYSEIIVEDKDDFERLWQQAVKELCNAINWLKHPQEFGVVFPRYLPYTAILPAFAAVQSAIKELRDERKLDAQNKIKRWYWASVFTNRYSSAVESTSAGDYQDLKRWFNDDTKKPFLLASITNHLEPLDLRREVKRGAAIYNGIFNLLVMQGARDWATGTVPLQDGWLDDHHIVPQSWGKKHNPDTSINTILNRAPLSADTNRRYINDQLPNKYLPKLIQGSGEENVREILESHLISRAAFNILMRDPFTPDDYEEFIAEREQTLLEEIKKKVL